MCKWLRPKSDLIRFGATKVVKGERNSDFHVTVASNLWLSCSVAWRKWMVRRKENQTKICKSFSAHNIFHKHSGARLMTKYAITFISIISFSDFSINMMAYLFDVFPSIQTLVLRYLPCLVVGHPCKTKALRCKCTDVTYANGRFNELFAWFFLFHIH